MSSGNVTAIWAALTSYTLNSQINVNSAIYTATTAGVSGSTAPAWPGNPTAGSTTVTDGSVVWTFTATNIGYNMTWSDSTLKSGWTIEAGTIDTSSTTLSLTGKGVYNWGQQVQENFVHLLENFASNGHSPAKPTIGQLWYDTTVASNQGPKFYNKSSGWQTIAALDPTLGIITTNLLPSNITYLDTNGQVPLANMNPKVVVTDANNYVPLAEINPLIPVANASTGYIPQSFIPPVPYMIFQGGWNAATNSPALTSSVGTKGYVYKVTTQGTTNLNGQAFWCVGDYVVYNGSTWDRLLGPNASGVPYGMIMLWSGSTTNIPFGWHLCNGNNSTPNLTDRFVIAAGNSYSPGQAGGNASIVISASQLPVHTHGVSASSDGQGSHAHGGSTSGVGDHQHTPQDLGSSQAGQDNGGSNTRTSDGFAPGGRTQQADLPAGGHSHTIATDVQGYHAHNIYVSIANAGGSSPVDIRPPYYALCYIMYTGS